MIKLPDNPIAKKIPLIWPIKSINISMPDTGSNALIIHILPDVGLNISMENKKLDTKKVKCSGWSRMQSTYIKIVLVENTTPDQIENWISDAGWKLGAGYMYRWHHAPGKPMNHLFGMERYSVMGEELETGDYAPDLSKLCEVMGCWSWEINCAYLKKEGSTAYLFKKWREDDQSLTADGSRADVFPGWDGQHPFLRATELNTGYESHYFFYKSKKHKQNKNISIFPLTKEKEEE